MDFTGKVDVEEIDALILDVCQKLDTCQYNYLLTISYSYDTPCYDAACYHCGQNQLFVVPADPHNAYYVAHELGHFYEDQMGFTCDGWHENSMYFNIKAW